MPLQSILPFQPRNWNRKATLEAFQTCRSDHRHRGFGIWELSTGNLLDRSAPQPRSRRNLGVGASAPIIVTDWCLRYRGRLFLSTDQREFWNGPHIDVFDQLLRTRDRSPFLRFQDEPRWAALLPTAKLFCEASQNHTVKPKSDTTAGLLTLSRSEFVQTKRRVESKFRNSYFSFFFSNARPTCIAFRI